jgi:quercetin dioxygenase-like cupin family protein
MATHHAIAGEQVDLETWANDLPFEHSKVIVKTKEIELARLVLQSGSEMHKTDYCRVKGTIVIHCVGGEIKVRTRDTVETLVTGQLLYLEGGTEHALMGVKKSVVLLTIVLC